jgi:polysaccharide deacetylase family protein (PEP-CTERM system associated)
MVEMRTPLELSPLPPDRKTNGLSVDVEDYFQVQALEAHFDRSHWDTLDTRVERNTDRVLQLFSDFDVRGTFFTLAWVAERHKDLIRRIVDGGHEMASHGMSHYRADRQTPDEFRDDVRKSKQILEDISGTEVKGYRAATFSINAKNLWTFEILAAEGYTYSSSINPVRRRDYGMPNAPRFAFKPVTDNPFQEFPISSVSILGWNIPCAGGGYFRLWPYALTKLAIEQVNKRDGWPFIFYFHPWELDPDQPRPSNVALKSRFRHYLNLNIMEARLRHLLSDFSWDRMDRVFFPSKTDKSK